MSKPMREAMPKTAAFLDECLAAFGKDSVQGSIRAGMAGIKDCFHAAENGREVGTPFSEPKNFVTLDQIVIRKDALPPMPHRRVR